MKKKDDEIIKQNDDSKRRNRRCRVCTRPVKPTSYWFCYQHDSLKGVDDTEEYPISSEAGAINNVTGDNASCI